MGGSLCVCDIFNFRSVAGVTFFEIAGWGVGVCDFFRIRWVGGGWGIF